MPKTNFAGPIDALSVIYLSDINNLSDKEKAILPLLADKDSPGIIRALLTWTSQPLQSPINHYFIACMIDQLCKVNKKKAPQSIVACCESEVLSAPQKQFLEQFLIQINITLNHESLPYITDSVDDTVFNQFIEYSDEQEVEVTMAEKNWFIYYHTAQLYFQKGYFLNALTETRRILKKLPEKALEINDILEQSWQMVEGLKLGVILRLRTQRVSPRDEKLLAEEKPIVVKPLNKFWGSEDAASYIYLSDYQQFGATERGIIYNTIKRDYNIALYSILRYINSQEKEKVDWKFLLCIIDQFAKTNNLQTSEFIRFTINKKKWSPEEWHNDIKLYFEQVQRSLLNKSLPDISETVDAKATDLTNKLQIQQKANWSKIEWQATFHRAQAWVYIRKGYYIATYEAAVLAKRLADGSEEGVKKYFNTCGKFVEARDLGRAMAKTKVKAPKHAKEIQWAFQASETPSIPAKIPSSALSQLNIFMERRAMEKFRLEGPSSVYIGQANGIDLVTILEQLSTKIITKITLRDCKFTHRLPDRLFEYEHLTHLSIIDSHLDRLPTDLGKLNNLTYLNLSGLSPIKVLPESLTKLPELSRLRISLKDLTSLPVNFQKLTKLNHLTLVNSKSYNFPLALCEIPTLEYLNLEGNQYTNLPNSISKLQNLKELKLQNNPWKVLPSSVLDIPNLQQFQLKVEEINALEVEETVKVALQEKLALSQAKWRRQDEFYRKIGK